MRAQPGFQPHVSTLGQGPRRALALHCTMAFGGAWAGLARHLGERLTLRAPDMPSHGASADWDEACDFSETVYQASLSALESAPMDLIGHSFGAATALRLAVEHPGRVRSLTVIEPVFFALALRRQPEVMEDHDNRARAFTEAIARGDRVTAARTFNRMWSTEAPRWDSLPERTRAAMARAIHVVPDTHGFLYDDTAGLLAPGALDSLQVPTLVMRGAAAHPAIVAVNGGLEALIPGATQSVIAGAGHMAPISHPDAVARDIAALLDRS